MDTVPNNLEITPEEMAMMQRLFTRMRSTSEAVPSHLSHAAPPPSQLPSHLSHAAPPPSQPPPSQPSLSIPPPSQPLPSQSSNQPPLQVTQPITEPYLSSAIPRDTRHATSSHFGHPAPSTSRALPSSQPFLGFNELSVNMTSAANHRRLASAATHLPRQPSLPTRGSRINRVVRRGPAVHPPSVRPRGPVLEDCITSNRNGNDTLVRIRAYIYPPKPPRNSRGGINEFVLYRNASREVEAFLERFGLSRSYEVPLSTSLRDFIDRMSTDLENSENGFTFTQHARSRYIPGYQAPVMDLLSIINQGHRRPSTGAIHLRPAHAPPADLNAIVYNRSFMIPRLTIQDSRVVLYFVIRDYPVTLLTAVDPTDDVARLHTCLSLKFYFMFTQDAYNSDPNEPSSDEDNDDEEEEELFHEASRRRPRRLNSARVIPHNSSTLVQPPTSPIARPSTPPLGDPPTSPVIHSNPLQRGDSLVKLSVLPRTIWKDTFIPSPGLYDGIFTGRQAILDKVYEVATSGSPYFDLDVRGTTVEALASELRTLLERAVNKGDFTEVLSPYRTFHVINEDGSDRSNGVGVEREVILYLYQSFKNQESRWFHPNDDGFSLLATSLTLAASQNVSKARMQEMAVLGAVISLCIVRGITAAPLDPLFLLFCVHGCSDINVIHPALLAEWHPERKQIISDWNTLGPRGDPITFQNYLACYHDLQVAPLRDRDQSSHDAMSVQMLYRAVVGPEPPTHPEILAFRHGFDLPCSNGFRFTEVLKSVPGGCESFIAKAYSSHISSFEALFDHLDIDEPLRREMAPIRQALGDPSLSLTTIFIDFLRGKGAPCPRLLSAVSVHFPSVVDLSRIGEDGFRAKHFCWAATGTYERELGAPQIKVRFVEDDDPAYAFATRHSSLAMASEGKISYATCFQSACIPISYALKLAEASYPDPSGEPKSFVEAVHHWLVCEILNAVGAHTIP